MAIPAVVHRVWAGEDPIPYRFRAHADTWLKHHPGWEHRLWTPAELDCLDMVNRDLYDKAEQEAPTDWLRWRADIARLEILHRHGGVYVDTDAECLKPLDPLRRYAAFVPRSPNDPSLVTNAVMGAEPGHPWLRRLLDGLPANAAAYRGSRLVDTVGGKYMTRTLPHPGVNVLPWQWFAAQSIRDRDAGRPPDTSQCFAWHKYDNTRKHRTNPAQVAAFRAAADALNEAGITWWLSDGALLGHIREGRFLDSDPDVDLGVWADDMPRVKAALGGLSAVTRDRPHQLNITVVGVKVDIHGHERDGDQVWFRLGRHSELRYVFPAALFDAMQPTIFYLRRTLAPSPPEEYLTAHYGDWTVPRKRWRWDADPPCLEVQRG
ncbi:MAG TPA: glycosyltransferase [Propionibacteriaceae bacterium]|nr:glycosyltransferase [Propionibacteriaceae bacterium]